MSGTLRFEEVLQVLALLGTSLLALLPLVALGNVRSEDYCLASAREDRIYTTSK